MLDHRPQFVVCCVAARSFYRLAVRALFDIVHPAHVHFYRHLIAELERAGHDTLVVSRDTDVTGDLLDSYGIPHVVVRGAGRAGRGALAVELARRDAALVRLGRSFRPDVVLTRNPSGVHAARFLRASGVFDTDDGREVGLHFRLAEPFAHVITSPDCLGEDYGPKHAPYPSLKPLAFLHPNRFEPDPAIRAELGVGPADRYFILRLVAFASSHDLTDVGLGSSAVRSLVDQLERHGRVFVTSERPVEPYLTDRLAPIGPHRMHDALAFANLCVTDGQSMAGEAAVLGVPSIRYNSTSGRVAVFRELRDRYGLLTEFLPGDDSAFLAAAERFAADGVGPVGQRGRDQLLEDKCDLTTWMADRLLDGRFVRAKSSAKRRRAAPPGR